MKDEIKNRLFEIAKCISNEYVPLRDTFNPVRKNEYYYISSNKCDMCPFIKVYCDPLVRGVEKVEVNGDYTNGWQDVHAETMEKVKQLVKNSLTVVQG